VRYAFELASKRDAKHLTSATKSNGIAIAMPYWDERVKQISHDYPDITCDKFHIDALSAQFVLAPDRFDVIVASNLFGDILSDLGPACTGTIGIAPSANINPEGVHPSLFEPVHGSAPDIAGQGIANPVGQIWAVQMMLEHFGEGDAAKGVLRAIEHGLSHRQTRTADLGGQADSETAGRAIADAVTAVSNRELSEPPIRAASAFRRVNP
jgi:tartrate dehydrogenase/decarboxylase/D-malate dehydrogenase